MQAALSMSGGAGIEKKAFLPLTREHKWPTQVSVTLVFQNTGPATPSRSQVTTRKRPWPGCCGDLWKHACLNEQLPWTPALWWHWDPRWDQPHTVTTDWKKVFSREVVLSDRNSSVRDQLLKDGHFLTSLALKSPQQILWIRRNKYK